MPNRSDDCFQPLLNASKMSTTLLEAAVATTQQDLQAIQEEAQRAADAPAVPQPTPSMAP